MLRVSGLVTSFKTDRGYFRAVDGVSFEVAARQTVALVGESGCGKSVSALSVMRLVASPPGRIESGEVAFDGRSLLTLDEKEMRSLRGNDISMIFQEPMTSLNPVYTVGQQIIEALQLHERIGRKAARARSVELLKLVGIPAPQERVDDYAHQLSGGMRQRVMIAIALCCNPKLLIADEPTTALDVTIQAQIMELLARLQRELGMSILLITHDLGIVAEFVERVYVMYAGKVVENASTEDLFRAPKHPYTRGLLASVPSYENIAQKKRLHTIAGVIPDLSRLPPGCRFQDRCPDVIERCRAEEPELRPIGAGRSVACHVANEEARS